MKIRLTLTFGLLAIAGLLHGQKKDLKIEFFCPDDWEGELDTSYFRRDIKYFGVYEGERYQRESIVLPFNGKDSVTEGPFGKWRKIETDSVAPTLIVAGLEFKKNARIPGIHINRRLFPGESVSLILGTKGYTLYVTGEPSLAAPLLSNVGANPFSRIKNYRLTVRLEEGKHMQEQVLWNQDLPAWSAGGYEGGFGIKWIGDLDGDNNLDILMTTSSDFRAWEVILYKGVAEKSTLLKEIGRYGASGE